MILWLWLTLSTASAIDINDHLILELDGGERIEGWFLRSEGESVVVAVPASGRMATIPLGIVQAVTLNDAPQNLADFRREVEEEWDQILAWRADPPAHPHPGFVAGSGVLLAGTGHAMLGEWRLATPMMMADGAFMGLMAMEAAGAGTGRIDIFFTAALLSTVFKAYALSDGHRRAKRRRVRLGLAGSGNEKSPS